MPGDTDSSVSARLRDRPDVFQAELAKEKESGCFRPSYRSSFFYLSGVKEAFGEKKQQVLRPRGRIESGTVGTRRSVALCPGWGGV